MPFLKKRGRSYIFNSARGKVSSRAYAGLSYCKPLSTSDRKRWRAWAQVALEVLFLKDAASLSLLRFFFLSYPPGCPSFLSSFTMGANLPRLRL